jgi:hypothetical protein
MHLRHHVPLHGRDLHGLGIAVHMHQADAALRVLGHDRKGTRLSQGPDVVDDVRPCIQHGTHDLGLECVHRHRHAH